MTGAKQFLNVWMRAYTDVPKRHTRVPEMDYLKASYPYTEFEKISHVFGCDVLAKLLHDAGVLYE